MEVEPASARVVALTAQAFAADVRGTLDPTVVWSVDGVGAIDGAGVFIAPELPPLDQRLVRVRATSVQDPSRFHEAQVEIIPPPLSPGSGQTSGGTRVEITGSDFGAGTIVRFDGIAGTDVEIVNPALLRVSTPPRLLGTRRVDVRIERPDASVTEYPKAFRYSATRLVLRDFVLDDLFACPGGIQGGAADSMAMADVDADGSQDVIDGCAVGGAARLWRGDPGLFVRDPEDLPGPPGVPAAADLDGDGDPDIAILSGATVTTLENSGGGFLVSGTNSLPAEGYSLALARLDADAYPDLIATSSTAVLIALNDGAGSFGAVSIVPTGRREGRVVFPADLDGDTTVDLVTGFRQTSAVDLSGGAAVFYGDGVGGFSAPTLLDFGAGSRTNDLTLGDFNGDGSLDLAAASVNSLSVRYGDGAGGFGPLVTIAGLIADRVLAPDFDGDGFDDLAVSGLNASGGYFGSAGGITTAFNRFGYPSARFRAIADLDADGKDELLFFGGVSLHAEPQEWEPDASRSVVALATREESGVREIVAVLGNAVATSAGGIALIRPGDDSMTLLFLSTGSSPIQVAAADLDGDGDGDLALADSGAASGGMGAVWTFEATAAGWLPAVRLAHSSAVRDVAAADLDGDGLVDLAVATAAGLFVHWGAGAFEFEGAVPGPSGIDSRRLVVGLFGGETEVAVSDGVLDRVHFIRAFGDRTFEIVRSRPVGENPMGLLAADLDDDGLMDLAVIAMHTAIFGGNPKIAEIDLLPGAADYERTVSLFCDCGFTAASMAEPILGDLDADGTSDLATRCNNAAFVGTPGVYVSLHDGDGFGVPVFSAPQSAPFLFIDLDGDDLADHVQVSGPRVLAFPNRSR